MGEDYLRLGLAVNTPENSPPSESRFRRLSRFQRSRGGARTGDRESVIGGHFGVWAAGGGKNRLKRVFWSKMACLLGFWRNFGSFPDSLLTNYSQRTAFFGKKTSPASQRAAFVRERTRENSQRTASVGERAPPVSLRTASAGEGAAQNSQWTASVEERTAAFGERTANFGGGKKS